MHTSDSVFILSTNHFEKVEPCVRSRCHCIPFNAAPAEKWLLFVHRVMANAGLRGISNQQLLAVIQNGKGSACDIRNALMDVVM